MAQITTMEQLREIIPTPTAKAFAKIRDRLCSQGIAFLERCPFAVLATIGEWGVEVSQKGGAPGFIEVLDERTFLIPEYKGNQFALALGNILADSRIGLALLTPGTDEVLRISGRATLVRDPEICERLSGGGKPAVLAIRVEIDRAAFHCPRSARRAGLWQADAWSEPMTISFGQIYAESMSAPEVRELFDQLSKESDASLY
ncbi:MAG: pyridoxamine 5'-phosphate oxidase family protein [Novosphingobium sp.]|nr:pyridoxamine 5'-phosphate oxidase family protein [Novosphingobium sp.]